MSFQLSERSMGRLEGVNPALVVVAQKAIQITQIDFGIPEHGGNRTAEEQNELFKAGLSKADGYTNQSYHQSGNALDFYAYVDKKASWEKEHMAMVAAAFLQAAIIMGVRIEWGGLWKSFVDMPHIQLMK